MYHASVTISSMELEHLFGEIDAEDVDSMMSLHTSG